MRRLAVRAMLAISTGVALIIGVSFGVCGMVYQTVRYILFLD